MAYGICIGRMLRPKLKLAFTTAHFATQFEYWINQIKLNVFKTYLLITFNLPPPVLILAKRTSFAFFLIQPIRCEALQSIPYTVKKHYNAMHCSEKHRAAVLMQCIILQKLLQQCEINTIYREETQQCVGETPGWVWLRLWAAQCMLKVWAELWISK